MPAAPRSVIAVAVGVFGHKLPQHLQGRRPEGAHSSIPTNGILNDKHDNPRVGTHNVQQDVFKIRRAACISLCNEMGTPTS